MRIFLALVILLNSFVAVAGPVASSSTPQEVFAYDPSVDEFYENTEPQQDASAVDCKANAAAIKSKRGPASAPACQTPAQLMAVNISNADFSRVCQRMVAQDPGCQRLKPEKRMSCSGKRENMILSSANLLPKVGQCLKGLLWDSMVDLGKFILDIIKFLVKAQVNSVVGMVRFLTDSTYRERTIAAANNAANQGSRLGMSFLRSSGAYFAREYPRNLMRHPFNPMLAVGETLLNPLMRFITQSVEAIADYYIPQYQCMNGTAKLYTICKVIGDFVMPPAFMFAFLKNGVNGLRALAGTAKVASIRRRFGAVNEISDVLRAARRAESAPRITVAPATRRLPAPPRTPARPPVVHPPGHPARVHPPTPRPVAELPSVPLRRQSPDDLIEVARAHRAENAAEDVANGVEDVIPAGATPSPAPTPNPSAAAPAGAPAIVETADAVAETLMRQPEYREILQGLAGTEKAQAAHAIEQLSKGGTSPAIVVNLFNKLEPQIASEIARAPSGGIDHWAQLGRYIQREKAAGKTDQAIQRKIEDAFQCK